MSDLWPPGWGLVWGCCEPHRPGWCSTAGCLCLAREKRRYGCPPSSRCPRTPGDSPQPPEDAEEEVVSINKEILLLIYKWAELQRSSYWKWLKWTCWTCSTLPLSHEPAGEKGWRKKALSMGDAEFLQSEEANKRTANKCRTKRHENIWDAPLNPKI